MELKANQTDCNKIMHIDHRSNNIDHYFYDR